MKNWELHVIEDPQGEVKIGPKFVSLEILDQKVKDYFFEMVAQPIKNCHYAISAGEERWLLTNAFPRNMQADVIVTLVDIAAMVEKSATTVAVVPLEASLTQ